MLFALICRDKPGHLQTRQDTRPAHVAYLNALNDRGALMFAGPFHDGQGSPDGSLVVISAADRPSAEAIAADDPYAKAGLFESVEIRPWNWVFNKPAGA
ncbi:putative protein YciI [Aquamicrobium terrae]|uniref:YciI-like protein n=1 Tax=Mesorhizobium sp. PUT5 TaxID=3454629 RepID=UPI003FA43A5A